MPRKKRGADLDSWKTNRPDAKFGKLRIVGGKHRGRQINYSGDPRTRPMKDNIREAVFNLVGGFLRDKYVIDLFSGTGAIGLEAISRGAKHAVMIERHFPTARIILENVAELETENVTTVVTSDTFFWTRQFLSHPSQMPRDPWAVFCSPPYGLFEERKDDLMTMLGNLIDAAPPGSLFVVESDDRFSTELLPAASKWKVRHYAPAQICVLMV